MGSASPYTFSPGPALRSSLLAIQLSDCLLPSLSRSYAMGLGGGVAHSEHRAAVTTSTYLNLVA